MFSKLDAFERPQDMIRVGVSASILDRYNGTRPLDGIGVYTQSLLREYEAIGLDYRAYAYRPVAHPGQFQSMPSSFNKMVLGELLKISGPAILPVDIFHSTDYRVASMKCPVVATLYDAIPFVDPSMANTRFRRFKNFVLRRLAQNADHVIAISNYAVDELVAHYGIPSEKISVVYCGVEADWLEKPNSELVDRVLDHRKVKPGYFLTVGTIQPRKNLERVLRAHSQLSKSVRQQHPVVVVGKAGWNCEAIIELLRYKVSIGEAHWFIDVESREELKSLYAGALGFVFPSLHEGFGLPILEAFAVGVPVLTSNRTSLPEVSAGIGLEVDPTNLSALVDGMLQLIDLPDRDERILLGQQRARMLTWKRCALETLAVYQKVIDEQTS